MISNDGAEAEEVLNSGDRSFQRLGAILDMVQFEDLIALTLL